MGLRLELGDEPPPETGRGGSQGGWEGGRMTTPDESRIARPRTGAGEFTAASPEGGTTCFAGRRLPGNGLDDSFPERVRTLRAYFRRERIPSIIPHPRFETDHPLLRSPPRRWILTGTVLPQGENRQLDQRSD